MCRLIESICLIQGKFLNLAGHEKRYAASYQACFGILPEITLGRYLSECAIPADGWYKCRLLYNQTELTVDFVPYVQPKIQSATIIDAGNITYDHKYASRPELDVLFNRKGQTDEIIMIKNGLVTDAYYYNLIFEKNNIWYTPAEPLLRGTMRQRCIDSGKLIPAHIEQKDIINFDTIHFINAMNGPGIITLNPRYQTTIFSQEPPAK